MPSGERGGGDGDAENQRVRECACRAGVQHARFGEHLFDPGDASGLRLDFEVLRMLRIEDRTQLRHERRNGSGGAILRTSWARKTKK